MPKKKSPKPVPQVFDVWQVEARRLDASILVDKKSVRPWMIVVISTTNEAILTFELLHNKPKPAQIAAIIEKAIHEPQEGDPHRPTMIEVRSELAADLGDKLDALNIDVQAVEEMEAMDLLFEELGANLVMPTRQQDQPGLLDMPGITVEAVGSFFDAAATFYELAPWKKTGERPIKVECDKFDSGPWYVVLMGQGGMTNGMVLYDDLDLLLRIQQGEVSEQENARVTAALSVVFGGHDDLVGADDEAVQEHGWRVAGPDAYPAVYRIEPGLVMRPPLAWELELLEGCLRAVPEFVRKKTRRIEPLVIAVPVAGEELNLRVDWAIA